MYTEEQEISAGGSPPTSFKTTFQVYQEKGKKKY